MSINILGNPSGGWDLTISGIPAFPHCRGCCSLRAPASLRHHSQSHSPIGSHHLRSFVISSDIVFVALPPQLLSIPLSLEPICVSPATCGPLRARIQAMSSSETPRHYTRGRLSRGRGLRNTTGCLNCRRRRVKCDESMPACRACLKINQSCEYSHVSTRTSSRRGTDVSGSSKSKEAGEELVPSFSSQNQAVNQDQEAQITAFTHMYDGPQGMNPDTNLYQTQQSQEEREAEIGGAVPKNDTATITVSSSAANVENATAIWVDLLLKDAAEQNFDIEDPTFRCDGDGFNTFGNSVVQLSPEGSLPQTQLNHGSFATKNLYLLERTQPWLQSQRLEKQAWYSELPLQISPKELLIFQNFIQNISLWMDLFDPKKPFTTHVPHLARHNVGLMNAVLALSARHLSLIKEENGSSGQDPNESLRYYAKTLHYIQEAMHFDTYKTSLELLSTSSIVSAYEMLDGSGPDWGRHLKGVFWIQRSQVIHGDSNGLQQAVWWAWLCQDVWAAFRENRRPYTFWRPTRTLDELDPYELSARSVYFFAQVVGFCSREETDIAKTDTLGRISRAEALQDSLKEWKGYLTAEFEPLPWPSSADDAFKPIWINPPAFAVATQLYYCSRILLLLNRPQPGGFGIYAQQRANLMGFISKVCGIAMTLTDYPSSVMCSQCLFIAGLLIEDRRQRNCVLDLLDKCRKRSGWPVKSLGEELKARWEKFENGG
ncbi:fungal-specific transcription factor domain-containing protein [Dactylonectria macrodidyma]|uniref:Fungal-specific transcription factor domain-containing protein n=1 Tax=Dactylonectria macrodidyma TaxID=307937 RepID=A0A9P9EBX0_9HYPO|nr:fungal-specific transcription factor domain-containing protein [Dactylonectria macrodidyma]